MRIGSTDDARSPDWDATSVPPYTLQGAVQMVKIRLRRVGRKNAPFYRILIADSQSPRDGKFIEIIGQYAPRQVEGSLQVDEARANHWLNLGAQPTDTVRSLLRRAGVLKRRHEQRLGIERKVVAVPLSEKSDEAAGA
ncbi:MAG TPA: 30S ribosomal protein S16 [Gemmatimonadaceae bacterium]